MRALFFLLGWCFFCTPVWAEAPEIVVTIRPIHALVSAVTKDVVKPKLLLNKVNSPHNYALLPADVRALNNSDFTFLVSHRFESFLTGVLDNLDEDTVVVELLNIPDLNILPARSENFFEIGEFAEHENHNHSVGSVDYHVWLSPANAIIIASHVAKILSEYDAYNASKYQLNLAELIASIRESALKNKNKLKDYSDSLYVVYHDAYQYFEDYFGLNAVGAMLSNGSEYLGARRLSKISVLLREVDVECIFSEPQFSSEVLDSIANDAGLRVGLLDPLGYSMPAANVSYADMLDDITDNIISCLANE